MCADIEEANFSPVYSKKLILP